MSNLDEYSQNNQQEIPWEGIVIHSMSQYIQGKHAIDYMAGIKLSAHYFIEPDGIVKTMVPVNRVAYHAGKSKWKDKVNLNSSFIGIELLIEGEYTYPEYREAIKQKESFTDLHYKYCAILCNHLMFTFNIDMDNIVRHSEIAGADVRKKNIKFDPGEGFDMEKLQKYIKKQQSAEDII